MLRVVGKGVLYGLCYWAWFNLVAQIAVTFYIAQ